MTNTPNENFNFLESIILPNPSPRLVRDADALIILLSKQPVIARLGCIPTMQIVAPNETITNYIIKKSRHTNIFINLIKKISVEGAQLSFVISNELSCKASLALEIVFHIGEP